MAFGAVTFFNLAVNPLIPPRVFLFKAYTIKAEISGPKHPRIKKDR